MKTALVMHEACGRHDTGWAHPEHQGRLPAIVNALYRDTPALLEHVLQLEGVPAVREDLLRAHTPHQVQRFERAVEAAIAGGRIVGLDSETLVSPASGEAALAAAGCAVTAAQIVLRGVAPTAFALTRPPGHHATADTSMGFCLLNNIAIAARWLRSQGLDRVLIVDWDVHHGNGTQDIFYADPSVYYLSLHQYPWYPGTGHPEERGEAGGIGANRNVQIAAGTARTAYIARFNEALDAALTEFSPDFILVSAGFDCLKGDPLGGLLLEPEDMYTLTGLLLEAASPAEGRLAIVLEGGYAPARTGEGVVQVMRALARI